MTTTTQSGVAQEAAPSFTEDDAAAQFMSRWSEEDPGLQASESPDDETLNDEADEVVEQEEADAETAEAEESEADPQEEEDAESTEETEGESEEAEPAKGKVLDDEAKVKLTVGDEELEVSVKDLKRLYGQEKALTQKSQQVAAQRKEVEAANMKAAAQLDRLHQKAAARWEPYSKIDMLVASKQLDTESFAALRAEAQAAYDDYRFITQEVDQFVQNTTEQRQQTIKAAAQEAAKTLADKIPGWNQKLYDDIRSYGLEVGLDANVVNNMVDANALMVLHKAMQFDRAKSVVTKKVNKTPTKVLKTTKTVSTKDAEVDKTTKAKQRLARSGSTDDAADLFLARWTV